MFKSYTRAADEIPLRAERACFRDFYTVPIANPSFISVRKECKGKLRIHRCYAYKENRGTCSIHFIREVVLRETMLDLIKRVALFIQQYSSICIPKKHNKKQRRNTMKSRKPTGHIVIFLETDLSKFKGFDESKLSTVQKMCFDQLSEQEKEKIRMGYGTSIIDCESEETICKFNMETYKPPKHALESFARSLVPIIQEFYEDENHMKEFEEWKKKRDRDKK